MAEEQTVLEGTLDRTRLPPILERIAGQAETGILTVQGEEDIVAVSFLTGRIVAADALNQTVEDGLGEVLVGQGLVDGERFHAASRDHQGGSAGSLGDLLVERGLLRRDQLLASLRMQTYRLMKQVLTWSEGEYRFYGGDEVSYEEGLEPLSVEELLLRALEDLGRAAGLPGKAPRFESTFAKVRGAPDFRIGKPDEVPDAGEVVLTFDESSLLERLDGKKTGAELAREAHLDRFQALYRLYRLVQKELVEEKAAPENVGAPAAPPGKVEPAAVSSTGALSGLEGLEAPPSPEDLGPDVFLPPEPSVGDRDLELAGADDVVDEDVEQERESDTRRLSLWAGRLLALVAGVLVLLGLYVRPGAVLWSMPWQESQMVAWEHQVRDSMFTKIDRAARAFFLSEAHYPDSLGDLVDQGYLTSSDLQDPEGHVFGYSAESVSYKIELLRDGVPVEGLGVAEAIAGDFLLDPQLVPPTSGKAPLFLIED